MKKTTKLNWPDELQMTRHTTLYVLWLKNVWLPGLPVIIVILSDNICSKNVFVLMRQNENIQSKTQYTWAGW